MTTERIQEHIDLANKTELVYLKDKELSDNVIKFQLYDNFQEMIRVDRLGYKRYVETLYMISKNPVHLKNQNFVGAVLDMGNDLHWYVMPSERGNGYMTKALNDVIINDVINERINKYHDKLRITIKEDNKASIKLAESVGFEKYSWDSTDNGYNWIIEISEY